MATNDYKQYAGSSGANVETQTAYASDATLANGITTGMILPSTLINKIWRQATMACAALGTIIASSGVNAIDDGNVTNFVAELLAALNQIMIVEDQKTTGTQGGSSTAGVQTRTLNTVVSNTINGASLASNQITLPAGIYRVQASAPAFDSNQHQIALYNVTDSAYSLTGTTENTTSHSVESTGPTFNPVGTRSMIDGIISISATKVFQINHGIQFAVADYGLGQCGITSPSIAMTHEVYTRVSICKIG